MLHPAGRFQATSAQGRGLARRPVWAIPQASCHGIGITAARTVHPRPPNHCARPVTAGRGYRFIIMTSNTTRMGPVTTMTTPLPKVHARRRRGNQWEYPGRQIHSVRTHQSVNNRQCKPPTATARPNQATPVGLHHSMSNHLHFVNLPLRPRKRSLRVRSPARREAR